MLITSLYHHPDIYQALSQQLFPFYCFFLDVNRRSKIHRRVNPSRATLAKTADCCERTISRYSKWATEKGLMTVTRTSNKYETCIYELTELGRQMIPLIRSLYNAMKWGIFSISLLTPAATPDVPLISLEEKNLYKECSSVRERQTAGVRATLGNEHVTGSNDGPSDYEKWSTEILRRKKESMMKIPDYVEQLTALLHLTDKGKYKLSSFNEETVNHGLLFIKTKKNSTNPFRDMLEECTRYAKEKRYPINWSNFYKMQEAGIFAESDFYTNKPMGAAKTQKSVSKAQLSPEQIQSREDRQKELVALEREKMREKTRQWMASKTPEEIKRNLSLVFPGMNNVMEQAGVSTEERNKILTATLTAVPESTAVTPPKKKELTANQLQIIHNKRETVRKLEADPNLNEFARIILTGFKAQLAEFDAEYGVSWTADDQKIVDWALDYISKMTVTKDAYQALVEEIKLGPTSPRAVNGELQAGLRLMKDLVNGCFLTEVKPPIEQAAEVIGSTVLHAALDSDNITLGDMRFAPLEVQGFQEV